MQIMERQQFDHYFASTAGIDGNDTLYWHTHTHTHTEDEKERTKVYSK